MSTTEQEAAPEPRQIDWATAEIREGTLGVQLVGDAPKGWAKHFDAILALLAQEAGRAWGEITLTKKGIKVSGVREGTESDLRHFLESVLLQVNSDVASQGERDPEEPRAQSDPREEADQRVTETFRGFAERDSAGT